MTDRSALDAWLEQSALIIAPDCAHDGCDRPATWEAFQPADNTSIRSLCQTHAEKVTLVLVNGVPTWTVQLAGT